MTGPEPAPAIDVRSVSFGFEEREVLRDISLTVPAGTVLGLMGRSGSGKSTLLNLLMGLLTEDSGEICLSGRCLGAVQRRGQGGYVPQKPSLMPWRTVLDNLILPAQVSGRSVAEAKAEAVALLERFDLGDTANLWPHQLSGGMAQRIAVLRGILFGSPLLYLDEPFSALDALTRLEFQAWLAELQRDLNLTAVLVTHDVREALALCHSVAVLAGQPASLSGYWPNVPTLGAAASPQQSSPELERELLNALLVPAQRVSG